MTQSTTGEETERERCERWTRRATTVFSSSWSRKRTLLSSQPWELYRLCQTLTGLPGPSHETSSSSGSLSSGSTSRIPENLAHQVVGHGFRLLLLLRGAPLEVPRPPELREEVAERVNRYHRRRGEPGRERVYRLRDRPRDVRPHVWLLHQVDPFPRSS